MKQGLIDKKFVDMARIEEAVNSLSETTLRKIGGDYYRRLSEKNKREIMEINRLMKVIGDASPIILRDYKSSRKELKEIGLWDEKDDKYYAQALKGELNIREFLD